MRRNLGSLMGGPSNILRSFYEPIQNSRKKRQGVPKWKIRARGQQRMKVSAHAAIHRNADGKFPKS